MIRIRVDDFPQTKGEPQHTLPSFRKFDNELTSLTSCRYLLGVIPNRCTDDDISFLKEETNCTIGLHGIEHDESKLDVYGNEFPPYLSKIDIRRMLLDAKNRLEDRVKRQINIYMPPRNRIDMRTAVVVNEIFDSYTGGPETDLSVVKVFQNCILSQPPAAYGRTDELKLINAHKELMRCVDSGSSPVLTIHHTWETNIGLKHMQEFFGSIPRRYFVDFYC